MNRCLSAAERECYTAHRLKHCRLCLRILPQYLVKDGTCHYCLGLPVDAEKVRRGQGEARRIGEKLRTWNGM